MARDRYDDEEEIELGDDYAPRPAAEPKRLSTLLVIAGVVGLVVVGCGGVGVVALYFARSADRQEVEARNAMVMALEAERAREAANPVVWQPGNGPYTADGWRDLLLGKTEQQVTDLMGERARVAPGANPDLWQYSVQVIKDVGGQRQISNAQMAVRFENGVVVGVW
jgi:hypothetical protein